MKIKSLYFIIFTITANLTAEQNPIFHAISQNNPVLVKNMLQSGQYSNTINENGQTILHAAVLANNWKAVKTILKSNQININQFDTYNKTAMDYAVEHGHNKMISKLYKNKGKVTSLGNAEYTKKIITRPFRIIFFIGLSIFLLIFEFCPMAGSLGGYKIMTGLFYGINGTIPMIIGGAGWISKSHRNLLLQIA
jgi:hypothetical protein